MHHGLRGAEADGDLAFVARLTRALGVPFSSARVDAAARDGRSPEARARALRYAALEQLRVRRGCAHIATAHHRDDQAETVLLRAVRGTGIAGLASIRPSLDAGRVLRPLLGLRRAELRDYLARARSRVPRGREQRDLRVPRNRLRAEVLPALESIHPGASARLAALAELARAGGRRAGRRSRSPTRRGARVRRTEACGSTTRCSRVSTRRVARRVFARGRSARGTRSRAHARAPRAHRRVPRARSAGPLALAAERLRAPSRSRAPLARARARPASSRAGPRRAPERRRARIPRARASSELARVHRPGPARPSAAPSRSAARVARGAQSDGRRPDHHARPRTETQGPVRERPMGKSCAGASIGRRAGRRDRLDSGSVARRDRGERCMLARAARRAPSKPAAKLLDCERIRAFGPERGLNPFCRALDRR